MEFNDDLAQELMTHIKQQTKQFMETKGLQMRQRCGYSPAGLNLKVVITPRLVKFEEKQAYAKKVWDAKCGRLQMKPDDFGQNVKIFNKEFKKWNNYTICGYLEKARKYPVLMRDRDSGTTFKFGVAQVRQALRDANEATQTKESAQKSKASASVECALVKKYKREEQPEGPTLPVESKPTPTTLPAPSEPQPITPTLDAANEPQPTLTTMRFCVACHVCMLVAKNQAGKEMDWNTRTECIPKGAADKYLCAQCDIDLKMDPRPSHKETCASCKQNLLLVDSKKINPREWLDEVSRKTVFVANEQEPKKDHVYYCWDCKGRYWEHVERRQKKRHSRQ